MRIFKDGVVVANTTYANSLSQSGGGSIGPNFFNIGVDGPADNAYYYRFKGYISNFRMSGNTCFYNSTFTPSLTPLANTTGTALLYCQDNRFVDRSGNNYIMSIGANTSTVPYGPFSTGAPYSANTVGGSAYFDGTGDRLDVSSNAAFNLSGDFTIELWWYATVSSNPGYLFDFRVSGSTTLAYVYQNTQYDFYLNGTQYLTNIGESSPYNRWNHFVAVRSGSTLSIYHNGVRINTASNSSTGSNSTVRIGSSSDGSVIWNGYISGFRIVKGTAVYNPTQTSITVPAAPLTAVANTSLLLNFTNAGIVDYSMQNDWESIGNVRIQTSTKKYGTGSVYFDGTDDRLVSASNRGYAFGTGDFTVEYWMNSNDVSSSTQRGTMQTSTTAGGLSTSYATGICFLQGVSGGLTRLDGGLVALLGTGSSYVTIGNSSSSIATGSWYHIALTRASGTARLFVNGTLMGSASHTASIDGENMCIGGYYNTSYLYNGYIDDLRITRGYARYTSNFTPPAAHKLL
jgi:hypothetical protein